MFQTFSWPEALVILAVVLIVFGVGKLPQVGGALGKGIREFRRGRAGLLDEADEDEDEGEGESGSKKRSPKKISGGKDK
jgi:sec-independent protein translocase protein TatA